MSQDQPEVLESRPSALTSRPAHEADEETDHGTVDNPLRPEQIRAIIRLFQCRQCSLPLRDPVTLPCGRSLCRSCLPEARTREHISYPATPGRLQGFDCPFSECGRRHALGDCSVDVILSKAVSHVKKSLEELGKQDKAADMATRIAPRDDRALTGVPVLAPPAATPKVMSGGRLVATYVMAVEGDLDYDADLSYEEEPPVLREELSHWDEDVYLRLKESVRTEMDCQVCYALFYDPLTTVCGHTFCRSCLHRVLDHSLYCPICRRGLSVSPLLHRQSCPSNDYLSNIIDTFWADAVLTRGDALAAEAANRHREFDIPIFICTLSFPLMPTFLHIFEPRYRLMIRRALEGDRTFGMVLPRRPSSDDDVYFCEYGTLLRIVNAEYFADGRSLIETQGISRFRVLRHGTLDGYMVAKIDRVDDVSLEEEEEAEARETQEVSRPPPPPRSPRSPRSPGARRASTSGDQPELTTTEEDVAQMSTRSLLDFAISFVDRMRQQSVPWLAQRILTIYGECPDDAAHFPWWFASILPVKEVEKYKLLQTTSVRERLKICCNWVVEWQTNRWYVPPSPLRPPF